MKLRRAAIVSVLGIAALAGGGGTLRSRYRAVVPQGVLSARGVTAEGHALGETRDPRLVLTELAGAALDRPLVLRYDDDEVVTVTARALGARIDVDAALGEALAVGRRGDVLDRYLEAREAATGAFDVPLHVEMPVRELASRLVDTKEEADEPPVAARRHLDSGAVEAHHAGRYLDVYAAADAVQGAVARSLRGDVTQAALPLEVDLPSFAIVPRATEEAARAVDVSTSLATYETHFGGPPGRDQNIARAEGLLDGVVLMPGEEVSFNQVVGARSVQNGFASAPEIYKGEMRAGIGGGVCQVASTLHGAAFFGGLEVVERQNHSRPSAYIRPGLDATVSYPVLDLRVRNPFAFAVVLHGSTDHGVLRFEVRGRERPLDVELATETAGIFKYTRKLEKTAGLSDVRVKQRGKNGMSIRRTKTVRDRSGVARVEVTTDVYPATQEILQIPKDFDISTLPPLPGTEPVGEPSG